LCSAAERFGGVASAGGLRDESSPACSSTASTTPGSSPRQLCNLGHLRIVRRVHFLDDLGRDLEASPAADGLAEAAIDLGGRTKSLSCRVANVAFAMAVANTNVHAA